jgi:3-hydroxyacyl-CoA dehydrogenase
MRNDLQEETAENHLKAAMDLARRRSRERSDGRVFSHVLVAGTAGQSLELAIALARSGARAFLLLEDAHEATRAADMLDRMIAGLPVTPESNRILRERVAMGVRPSGSGMDFDLAIIAETSASALATMLGKLERLIPSGVPVIVTSPTDMESLVRETGHPAAAMSFAGPVHLAQLAEVLLPGTEAGKGGEAGHAFSLAEQLGLLAVPTRSPFGLGEALFVAMWRETDGLLFDGASPAEVDEVMEAFGFAAGPCEVQDLVGVDVALAMRKAVNPFETSETGNAQPVLPFLPRMAAEGRLGRKVGVGFYRYPGGGGKVEDPLIEDLIREEAWFAGHAQDPPQADTIRDRLLAALSRQCTCLIDAGFALAGDLDLVSFHALGFPARHGGLARYARACGAGASGRGSAPE